MFVFTEQGVAMLSSVLRSPTAIAINISIMRAFVMLRHLSVGYEELRRRVEQLEQQGADTAFPRGNLCKQVEFSMRNAMINAVY
jgi:hypothetical protein